MREPRELATTNGFVQDQLDGRGPFPTRVQGYPLLRYMGSKFRLLPWIHEVLSGVQFETALDAFSGTGSVAYLLKAMGKQVVASDFLNLSYQIALATVANSRSRLNEEHLATLLKPNRRRKHFIERTFSGIFFTPEDLRFLDNTWANIVEIPKKPHRALAIASLIRSCAKRQPRGVFTVAGDPERYKDGRRDVRLPLRDHFLESVAAYNSMVFDNGMKNGAVLSDVFQVLPANFDLVYFDPPYVPRSDDNCYVKRYHFLEGLASYWTAPGTEILENTRVRKIPKRFTPFSYRRTSIDAFERLFKQFSDSILVMSYSSNGYPDLDTLVALMQKQKGTVEVFEKEHRYHFGTHKAVSKERSAVREYLIVGA